MKYKKGRSRSRDLSRAKEEDMLAMAERYLYIRKQMQNFFMQTNRHQQHLKGQQEDHEEERNPYHH